MATASMTSVLTRLLLMLLTINMEATAQFGEPHRLNPARPRLDPEQDEMIIATGGNLKLRCQSASPVRWQIPQEAESSAVKTVLFEEKEPDYPYIIHLEVQNVEYMQTGFYRCIENSTNDVEDGSKVASIYVYVSDPENLLAIEEYPPPITVDGNGRLVVPCRPTSPNITVSLKRDGEEILVGDENDVSYDPKIGYTYFKPHVIDSGEMICTAVSGSHSSTSNFEVHIPNIAEDVAAPSIHAPNHAIIDSSLELNCSVPFDVGVAVDLSWDVPDPSGKDSGRIVVGKLKEVKEIGPGGEQILAMLTLTIKKVLPVDEGNYGCTVKDNANNQKSEHKFIPVLEKGASYINLTVQGGKKNITAKADDPSVQWVVYHTAHPEPLLSWYDPEDKEIVSNSKYEVLKDTSTTRLMIRKPSIQDTGVYKLKATNFGTSRTEELFLNVLGGPYVNVSIEPYYIVNKEAEVHCFVVGNPTPVVRWSFRPCNFEPLEDCEPREGDELNEEDFTEEAFGKVQLKSKLRIFASRPGRLQCTACNVASGCVSKNVNFYVTDVPNGFDLVGPNLTVVGEAVSLKCSASVFHYYGYPTWTFNDSILSSEDGDHEITDSSEILSHQSVLRIKNVTKANEGLYSCNARPLHDDVISQKHLALNVTHVQAPRFGKKTNLMGNVKELAERQSFTLYCDAEGMPSPKIVWLKDKKSIQVKENFEILDNNKTLEFKYVTIEDDGVYTCIAMNRGGSSEASITINLLDKKKGVNVFLVVGLLVLAILLSIIIIYLFWRVRREQKLRQQLTRAGLMHFEEGAIENLNLELGVEDQAELLPYDRKFEFPREKLKLGKILGSGAFGVVVKADAFGIVEGESVTPVAVKMVKSTADNAIIKALASELKIMVHLGRHLNVVNLLGACTKSLNKMELMVIVEYCRYGNLHNYLMRHRNLFIDQIDPTTGLIDASKGVETLSQFPNGRNSGLLDSTRGVESPVEQRNDYRCQSDSSDNFVTGATEATFLSATPTGEESFLVSNNSAPQPDWRSNYKGDYKGAVNPITTRDLLCYAFQIARGMEYLASRKVLHGDLAARNVLLAENNIVKICDFGLAKSLYKDDNYCKKENGPLPIKWMAIESIRDRTFSTQSDVWSFGIVLWELFSLARTPYPGMAADEHMYKKLEDGYRMEKPNFATDELYSVMMDCWRARPTLRPSFTELVDRLGSMLEDNVRKHYVDLNEPYVQMNTRWQKESGHEDYLGMLSSPNYSNVMSPIIIEEGEPQRYQNIPRGAPTVVADSNIPGYLTMSPTDPNDIFSPRPGVDHVFKFHTPPQARKSLRDTEENDHIELRPMLSGGSSRISDSMSGHDSDSDVAGQYTAVPSGRPVVQTTERSLSPLYDHVDAAVKNHVTSFSNPSYSLTPNLITSQDNYVKYPQQYNFNNLKPIDGLSTMPTPTFSTFGRKPVKDVELPSYYANIPSQRAPLALSEFDDQQYVN